MWSRKQIIGLQVYRRCARLSDFDYRALLYRVTGERSSTARSLGQDDYDRVMAEIEEELCQRLAVGEADDPPAGTPLDYWRKRCPPAGKINGRQARLLGALADRLRKELPEEEQLDYLDAWLLGACVRAGCPVRRVSELTEAEANRMIEALKDRLRAAGVDTKQEGWTQGRTRRRVKERA